jgi:hypothetical protein
MKRLILISIILITCSKIYGQETPGASLLALRVHLQLAPYYGDLAAMTAYALTIDNIVTKGLINIYDKWPIEVLDMLYGTITIIMPIIHKQLAEGESHENLIRKLKTPSTSMRVMAAYVAIYIGIIKFPGEEDKT